MERNEEVEYDWWIMYLISNKGSYQSVKTDTKYCNTGDQEGFAHGRTTMMMITCIRPIYEDKQLQNTWTGEWSEQLWQKNAFPNWFRLMTSYLTSLPSKHVGSSLSKHPIEIYRKIIKTISRKVTAITIGKSSYTRKPLHNSDSAEAGGNNLTCCVLITRPCSHDINF